MLLRSRRAFRPRYRFGDSWYNAVTSLELPPDVYAGVLRAAKAWGVTLNDLLLAMLLTALAPEFPERLDARRRKEIAIASVINIRHELAAGPETAFGQFLSSFLVSHPVPEGITLEALARDVHAQTQRVKRRKLYLMTLYMIACGGIVWPYLTPSQRTQMHAKNYPVWAGMTMLNVEAIWNDAPATRGCCTICVRFRPAVHAGPDDAGGRRRLPSYRCLVPYSSCSIRRTSPGFRISSLHARAACLEFLRPMDLHGSTRARSRGMRGATATQCTRSWCRRRRRNSPIA
jgi:hypothetical protein